MLNLVMRSTRGIVLSRRHLTTGCGAQQADTEVQYLRGTVRFSTLVTYRESWRSVHCQLQARQMETACDFTQ